MKNILLLAAAAGLFAPVLPAMAQNAPAAPAIPSPANPAVKDPMKNAAAGPVAGANSFTEYQAQAAIENRGYTKVGGLKLDDKGVWRGTATKNGKAGPVSIDFQGNVN